MKVQNLCLVKAKYVIFSLLLVLILISTVNAQLIKIPTDEIAFTSSNNDIFLKRIMDSHKLLPLKNSKKSPIITLPFGNDEWTTSGPYGKGSYRYIKIAPSDTNIMYAVNAGIGLYKSIDGGGNWQLLKNLKEKFIYGLTIDPTNPDVVFVSTWSGIVKTTDGGDTWEYKNNGIEDLYFTGCPIISPDNFQIIYASAHNNIYKSEDGGENWVSILGDVLWPNNMVFDPIDSKIIYIGDRLGIWKTTDEGNTWNFYNEGLPENPVVTGIAIFPSNTDSLLIGTKNAIYLSSDGGNSWSVFGLEDNYITTGLKIDPLDEKTIYAGTSTGLYYSNDSGISWNKVEDDLLDVIINEIEINPSNPNSIFCAVFYNGLFKSYDHFNTWQEIITNSRNVIYEIAISADNSGVIYAAGRFSGLWKSEDLGQTWTRNNSELESYRITGVTVDPNDNKRVYCTDGKNFYKSSDGGNSWQVSNSGFNGAYIISITVSPSHPYILFAGTDKGLYRSNNGGNDWEEIGFQEKMNFVFMRVSPNSPDTLFASFWNEPIYRSTDGGQTWETIGEESLRDLHFSDLKFVENFPNVLYLSAYKGGIYKSEDYGETWQYVGFAGHNTNLLAIDPVSPNILYAGCWEENVEEGGVFVSIDEGQNWAALNTGLESKEIMDIKINPNNHLHLFTATYSAGVWGYSINNYPPFVQIVEPQQTYFEFQSSITFIGNSIDEEQGNLPDTSLVWFSSLQGELGKGDTLTIDSLAVGKHTITLQGTDSFGAVARDSIILTILPEGVGLVAVLEAEEDMYSISGETSEFGSQALIMMTNGALVSNADIHFSEKSLYCFTAIAQGWEFQGWPVCNFTADSLQIGKKLVIDSDTFSQFKTVSILDSGDYKIGFHYINDLEIQGQGDRNVALDKIIITEPVLLDYDVAMESIVSPNSDFSSVSSITPQVKLGNFGKNSCENFTVTCVVEKIQNNLSQEVYYTIQHITNLASLEEKTISFDPFSPGENAEFRFTFYHNYANDENSSNDTIAVQYKASFFTEVSSLAKVDDAGGGQGVAIGDYDLDGYFDIYVTKYGEENLLYHNLQNGMFENVSSQQNLTDGNRGSLTAGWFDYDSDGDADIIILNEGRISLYQNQGNSFSDVSAQAGVSAKRGFWGLAIGDYNNDGYLDVYATRFGPANVLFSNNKDGTFSDITSQANVLESGNNSSSAQFWDFDSDGDQDLLVVNHNGAVHLYRNNYDSTFSEISQDVGITSFGNSHHALIADYNNDGLLDLYVLNSAPDGRRNVLYRNEGGTFTDVTESAGVGDEGDCYGGCYSDFNNDGYVDFFVSNSNDPNVFYLNNGDGTFTNIAEQVGLDYSGESQGAAAFDYDNDGHLDIYLVNNDGPNMLYRNNGSNNNWLKIKLEGVLSNKDAMGAVIEVIAGGQKYTRLINGSPGWFSQSSLIASFGLGQVSKVDSITIFWPSGLIQDTTDIEINQLITIKEAVLMHDIGFTEILSPKEKATLGVSVNPTVRIRNYGAAEETNFELTCVIKHNEEEKYRNNQIISSLAPLHTINVTFDKFVPSDTGMYNVLFYNSITGDENSANDSLELVTQIVDKVFFVDIAPENGMTENRPTHGVAIGDYNNDGYQDVLLSNCGKNSLYQNDGKGHFSNVGVEVRLLDDHDSWGCIFADFNNDGFSDIYITNSWANNVLYLNTRNGFFANISTIAGVNDPNRGWGAAFADYDNDGMLDIYLSNDDHGKNILYKNSGQNKFTDVTDEAGVGSDGNNAGVTFGDYDNDGDVDLFVTNREGNSNLYRNNGDGTFTDVGIQANVAQSDQASGCVFGDYDNDGFVDLLIARAGSDNSPILYHNNGDGTFTDLTQLANLSKHMDCRSGVFLDYDNDGFLDIYITAFGADYIFHNNGDGTFSEANIDAAIEDNWEGVGAAWFDYDLDGDLDLFVCNDSDDPNVFYENQGTPNNWLIIKPQGVISNREGIGARIRVVSESFSQIREITAGSGLGSQNALYAPFGLGKDSNVDSVIIRWPSGIRQILTKVAINQYLTVIEDTTLVSVKDVENDNLLPTKYSLNQNYPNPFNPTTKIKYQIPRSSHVSLKIFNLLGEEIRTLVDRNQLAGRYYALWDGKNNSGEKVASGLYICQMKAKDFIAQIRVLLIR